MSDLPDKFPALKVSSARLAAIAERARQQAQRGTAQPERRRSIVQAWMHRAGIGVLDLVAVAAVLLISVSIAVVYIRGNAHAGRDETRIAIAPRQAEPTPFLNSPPAAPPAPPNPAPRVTPAPLTLANTAPPNKPVIAVLTVGGDGDVSPKPADPDPVPPVAPPAENPPVPQQPELKPIEQVTGNPPITLPPEDLPIPKNDENPPNAGYVQPPPPMTSGGFSNRSGGGRRLMSKHYNGSHETEEAVETGLQWLAFHQEPDGHWDAAKYEAGQSTDTAVTALATLALLGAGYTEKIGKYKENVIRAVAWLKSKQDENGLIFNPNDAGAHRGIGYPGAIATLAMVEAAGMARVPSTVKAAQAAVDYCTKIHQQSDGGNSKLGWRYAPNTSGDISVSAWFIAALKSARQAGLSVNPGAFEGAIHFLDSVERKGNNSVSQYSYMPGTETNKRRNAMGIYCRLILGWPSNELQASVDSFVTQGGTPSWTGTGENVDLYYWYYGTLCTFQQGGDVWKRWNTDLKSALLSSQAKKGDNQGSWPVVGEFSGEWGRVGQTALGCLCLEVYYRYPRLNSAPAAVAKPAPAVDSPNYVTSLVLRRKRVTLNLVNKTLDEALKILNDVSEVKFIASPEVKNRDARITIHVPELPFDFASDWVAKEFKLERKLENGVVVFIPQQPAEKDEPPPEPESEPKKQDARTPVDDGF